MENVKRLKGSVIGSAVWNFIKLTRVFFLLGGCLLYALGAFAAIRMGQSFDWRSFCLGQAVVLSIQLTAHYLNEYYDIRVDGLNAVNRTWFSGGSGILPAGGLSAGAVLSAARLCALAAILLGSAASVFHPAMIPVFILSLLGSWFYSAPPVTLMSSGWGEATTSLIVAFLVPTAGFFMQSGSVPGPLWLIILPLIPIHAAMLVTFEFPDFAADLAAGKNSGRAPGAAALSLGDRWFDRQRVSADCRINRHFPLSRDFAESGRPAVRLAGSGGALGSPLAIACPLPPMTAGAVALFGSMALLTMAGFVFNP